MFHRYGIGFVVSDDVVLSQVFQSAQNQSTPAARCYTASVVVLYRIVYVELIRLLSIHITNGIYSRQLRKLVLSRGYQP